VIWQDAFTTIPAPPRYVIEKPTGTAPFSLLSEGGLRVRYRATSECPRAEFTPRTDADNKVGIRLPKRKLIETGLGIKVRSPVQKQKSVLVQWYQTKLGNPPLSLELVYDRFRLVRLWFETAYPGYNPNREVLWEGPCARNIWYDFDFETVFDNDPAGDGYIAIHLDGELEGYFEGPNCYGDELGLLPKHGIYRPGARDKTVPLGQETLVEFRDLRIDVAE
jgi:hypothetical protein